ncbi:hypothetical protein BTD07_17325 [Salmonella enterica]|uniref:hypothetical protein n=1 Tax=Citrobacter braakii TaxID=57706 RepID=UPI00180F6DD7|nr:hypothetical protein [Salmonella enterica subsp. enterica serovar Anatum]EAZ1757973.1 hypothetical protein [Salmonella enterica]
MENILSKKQKKHLKKTYLNTEKKIRNRITSNRKTFYCGIAVLAVLTAYSLFKPKEQQRRVRISTLHNETEKN